MLPQSTHAKIKEQTLHISIVRHNPWRGHRIQFNGVVALGMQLNGIVHPKNVHCETMTSSKFRVLTLLLFDQPQVPQHARHAPRDPTMARLVRAFAESMSGEASFSASCIRVAYVSAAHCSPVVCLRAQRCLPGSE